MAVKSTVKVEGLAEQLSYSFDTGAGTHTRQDYVRGDVFEMDEESAINASEGVHPGEMKVAKNAGGTMAFTMPPKEPRANRAAVRILPTDVDAKLSKPVKEDKIVPAPEPGEGKRK